MGEILGSKLRERLSGHPQVGDIRGCGLFWALEFVRDRDSKNPFPSKMGIAWRVWQRAFDLGLVVYYSQGCANGVDGDLIMLGPPLIIDEEQIDLVVQLLERAVLETFDSLEM